MTIITTVTQLVQGNPKMLETVSYVNQFFASIKTLIAVFGALAILVGALLAVVRYIRYRFFSNEKISIDGIRLDLASTIILGLEFFVASDVIETTIAPDFSSLGVLGLLVVIRTFLNYTLQKEVQKLSGEKVVE
ncbi:MAG: conserved putative rane protein [Gammaproteobacteria bacterium]|nr:conserved putative rane protein [Gammaproteobacteria bacterium]